MIFEGFWVQDLETVLDCSAHVLSKNLKKQMVFQGFWPQDLEGELKKAPRTPPDPKKARLHPPPRMLIAIKDLQKRGLTARSEWSQDGGRWGPQNRKK